MEILVFLYSLIKAVTVNTVEISGSRYMCLPKKKIHPRCTVCELLSSTKHIILNIILALPLSCVIYGTHVWDSHV